MISERSLKIIQILLGNEEYITIKNIANELEVSSKTISRDIDNIEKFLSRLKITLDKKIGVGIKILANCSQKKELKNFIASSTVEKSYNQEQRIFYLLVKLLRSIEPIKAWTLAELLFVSEATILNDLKSLDAWLDKNNLFLVRHQGVGIYIDGGEHCKRKALIKLLYENIDISRYAFVYELDELDSETKKFLSEFVDIDIINKVRVAVNLFLQVNKECISDNALNGLLVHLAMSMQRILKKEYIAIDREVFKDLQQKDAYKLASLLAQDLKHVFKVKIPDAEIAYITMHLLGTRNEYVVAESCDIAGITLVKLAMDFLNNAEGILGLKLPNKDRMVVDLVKHLNPAIVRIKMNMGIRNPLLDTMNTKYYRWMEVSRQSIEPLLKNIGINKFPDEEIGFLAMHLGASLVKLENQNKKYKVVVTCPSGLGSSRLIATQLIEKFLDLEVVDVIPLMDLANFIKENDVDFVVSSIEIKGLDIPYVKVNYILSSKCIKEINNLKNIIIPQNNIKKHDLHTIDEQISLISQLTEYINKIFNILVVGSISANNLDDVYDEILLGVDNREDVLADIKNREQINHTIMNKIMILHARTSNVKEMRVNIFQLKQEIDLGEKVKGIILILAPKNLEAVGYEVLSFIPKKIVDTPTLVSSILNDLPEKIVFKVKTIYRNYLFKKIDEIKGGDFDE